MDTRIAGKIFASATLVAAITLGLSAQPQSSRGTQSATRSGAPIRLRAATFTPTRGERPAVRDSLLAQESPAGRRGYYIVQFDGPIEDEWKATLVANGADLLDYIPDFALKVRMNAGQAAQVQGTPHVVWVGLFHPAYKIPPDLLRDAQRRPFVVRIERGADVNAAVGDITRAGAQVLQRDGAFVTIAADATVLDAVAHVLDVAGIEAFALPQKHNELGGGHIMRSSIANAAGYDGSTQTIAITDTGLGGGTADSAHSDLAASRVAAIYNWPGVPSFCLETVVSDGPLDVSTGHGTHVTTSAVGGGDGNGVGRGTAPASRLVFQAVEDFAMPSAICQFLLGYTPGYYLAGIPLDVGLLFQQSYDAGARVHSNSWGRATNGGYTADSVSADTFLWAHRDLAVTISSGNSGMDLNADGLVDGGSVTSPATAKNVITVGASEGDRGADYGCDTALNYGACSARGGQNDVFTYGSLFRGAFPVNPLRDDVSAGNAEQMAAFSSRGPTTDGRIKPDVVAPGTWILSGYSERFRQFYDPAPNPQNGAYQYDGWGDPLNDKYKYMGGTSMAAPLVAGAAAVVRDYYEKAHAHAASAALVKATLVNSAVDLLDENNDGFNDNAYPVPNMHEGWGRVDLAAATDGSRTFTDGSTELSTGSTFSIPLSVDASLRPLKVTVAWTDAPGSTAAATTLVNDLDLELVAPGGATYFGNVFVGGWASFGGAPDRLNNVENVYVMAPQAGEWTVLVRGFNVPQGPQPFALVVGRGADVVTTATRVTVGASDPTATEAGATTGAFTLTRTGDLTASLTVSYVLSGTATAGEDFTNPSGTVTFAADAAQAVVTIQPIDDLIVESEESVVLTLVAGDGYMPTVPASATVVIASDDLPGDLVVGAITVPALVAGGSSVTISDTTRNQGTSLTTASQTGFYLSTNTSLDSTDTLLATRPVPALAAGATDTQSTSVTMPATGGTYYIIAKADWNALVIETSESNNTRPSTALRIGPDLTVAAVTVPTIGAAGGTIAVTDTTRNDGAEQAPASITALYLSTNSSIGVSDVKLGQHGVPVLAAGASHSTTTTVTVPADVAVGTYYVVARADDAAAVGESVESNNTRSSTTVKIGADLIVSAVSGPASATAGGSVSVTDTTRNQGGASATAFTTAFYLSSNSALDGADLRLGERAITSLAAGASSTATTTFTVPGSVPAGMYFLIANADDGHAIAEPTETNNTRLATTQVKVGPDLMIVSVGATSISGAGAPLTISDNIKNNGGGSSPPSEAVFYLSSNGSLDEGDVELARRAVPALAAGVSDAASTVVTIPLATLTGTYYVIAQVDPLNVVDEASETNNTLRSNTIRIGPDLTLTALSAPITAVSGSTLAVADTTRNTGGGEAAASVTGFYLSLNTVLDGSDIRLGSRDVPALAAGTTSAASTMLTIPATVAPGSYYLIANADDPALIAETSETNNTRRVTITVNAPTP